jgi:hypothetical protein
MGNVTSEHDMIGVTRDFNPVAHLGFETACADNQQASTRALLAETSKGFNLRG